MKELQVIEQREIEFYQDSILSVLTIENGEKTIYVPIRRLSGNFGLDSSGQLQRIKRSAILSEGRSECMVHSLGRSQYMSCLRYDLIPFWAATIEDSLVRPELRQKVIWYQKEVARVLAKEFLGINGHEERRKEVERNQGISLGYFETKELLSLVETAGPEYAAGLLEYMGIHAKQSEPSIKTPSREGTTKCRTLKANGRHKEYCSIDEACEMLNISRSTLYRKVTAGEIKSINLGSRLTRIPREELLRVRGGHTSIQNDKFFGNSHKIINTKKAAEIIGCNVSTVQRKCVAGRIRAFRDNTSGRWLIPFESIQKYESKKVRK